MKNKGGRFDVKTGTITLSNGLRRTLPKRNAGIIADENIILFSEDIIRFKNDPLNHPGKIIKIQKNGIIILSGLGCLCPNCVRAIDFHKESGNIILYQSELN